jgi:decaprenylphospho-beta-D-ribofuranose 2-oxidase
MNVRSSVVQAARPATRIGGGRRLLDFDPTTGSLVAEAGCTLAQVLDLTLPHGWIPPVLPDSRALTLGAAVGSDLDGLNHPEVGSIGRHLAWLEVAGCGAGEPQVLSPEGRPAQFWATVGGLGRTGAVTVVALRLRPVDGRTWTVRRRGRDLDEVMDHLEADHARADRRTDVHSVAWLDCSGRRGQLGRGVVHTTQVGLRDVDAPMSRAWRPRQVPWPQLGHGPDHAARLSATLLGLHRGERRPRFGHEGLVRYQLAVPARRSDVLFDTLALLQRRGMPPVLSSVRRLGVPDPGPLTFAQPGWALTLQLPARSARSGSTLQDLDNRVADAGGRVHLTGGHRPALRTLARMYPELTTWQDVRDWMDPAGAFGSDLSCAGSTHLD